MAHTPGPWKFVGECEPLPIIGSQFQVWEDMGNGARPIAAVVSSEDQSIGVTDGIANARLIAAAPELLAALMNALDMCLALNSEHQAYYDNVAVKRACTIADARAAIAKATGK